MTHLRKLMLAELERRNYDDSTRRAYLRIIEDFARHFHRPPDQLGPDHIREYTAHLFRDKKLSDKLGQSNCWSFAILLRQDAEAAMGRGGNALPEEENAFARDSEPG